MSLKQDVARLLGDLDSDEYSIRQRAIARLDEWVERPELAEPLANEVQRLLLRPELSFEVRWQLRRVAARLPEVTPESPRPIAPKEIDRVVRQLDDDTYAVRLGAGRRLQWILGHPKNAVPTMTRIKRRLADATVSDDARGQLQKALETARGAWLLSDPQQWQLAEVSQQQVARWVGQLVEGRESARRAAEEELRDVLAYDDRVAEVRQILEARQKGAGLRPEAAEAVKRLLELTRPAMVAEYWSQHRHLGEQHLLVGVPSTSARSIRPSHFDAIDDRVAHCVSGSNLSPGDYPVGVAIPHPNQENAFFRLVNLPNPRRRMAYAHQAKIGDEVRLRGISRRTLSRYLDEKLSIGERELVMFVQLDAKEVSRFAAEYFFAVEDEQLAPTGPRRLGGRPSRFGLLCGQLAQFGTAEAVPGLLKAIDQGRLLPPTSVAPYRLHWMAVMAIAERDPWPDVEDWLAETVGRDVLLVEGDVDGPQLGATAAGILLKRHDRLPARFSLEPAPAAELKRLSIDGYRFSSEDTRTQVIAWWEEEKERGKQP